MRYIKEIMIVAVCLMVLSFCVCTGFGIYFMYREGVQEYEDLRTYVKETDEDDHTEGTDGSDGKQTVVDFKALKKINPDIVAWIRIPDTSIDYPVVQGNDDSYYLTHTFKKTEHVAGAIFLDSDNNADFSDDKNIIYGHNMKDGSMFRGLRNFLGDKFLKEQIKDAVERYTKAQEITIIPVKPLYRLYSKNTRNTFFTSSLEEANHYQKQGYKFDYGEAHYLQGYVFEKEQPNTVPILRLYKKSNSNTFFTTSYQEAEYYNRKGYKPDHGITNYILGYVYKEYMGANTTAIYRMYKGSISNTFMTTNYNEALEYLKEGYSWDKGTTNYIQGYIITSDL